MVVWPLDPLQMEAGLDHTPSHSSYLQSLHIEIVSRCLKLNGALFLTKLIGLCVCELCVFYLCNLLSDISDNTIFI